MPDGVNQCWCEPTIVRGEYRNLKYEYGAHVPDGIAEILACDGIGTGFHISLTHPESGDGDYSSNQIIVSGTKRTRETFQELVEAWLRVKTSSQKNDDVAEEQVFEPEQRSLSSLPALHLKSIRNDPHSGRIVTEAIIANNPHEDIVYYITLISPADQYEKNQKLFKEIMNGFRYIPSGGAVSQ